jgi:signal transduction histidine kinase/CheY-like chemotaxis protein
LVPCCKRVQKSYSQIKMNLFNNLSIRKKIISIIIAVTIISVIVGLSIEIYSNNRYTRLELERDITLNAKLISDYSVPSLLSDNKKEAGNILQKLNNIPSVLHGVIYRDGGKIFAVYNKSGLTDTSNLYQPVKGVTYKNKLIYVTESITSEGKDIGKVYLVASIAIIREQTIYHFRTVFLIFLITVIVAVLLSLILERIISGPIIDLANITRKIQTSGDFSLRVKKKYSDNTGILHESFNDLLISLEERKQERDIAEKELIAERENLEKRVLERTKELNEAKLKAEESDKLKSSFLANMSHEIRTPLNAILGFSNLLMDSSTTQADRLDYGKMMDVSAGDLIQLIDDILDISRIEANQLKITLADCQVNGLLKEIFEVFKQSIRVENHDSKVKPVLNIQDEKKDYLLNTDRLRLRQILLNLLNNALKFTPEGFIEIGYFIEENNQNLIFYVKDTGIGIPFIKLEKIFERFTKVADIKTKHYRGTGLGLSIALKLARLLKGDIRVESEENKGSIFYVSMPYPTSSQSVSVPSAPLAVGYSVSLQGKTVLIVEDVDWNYKFLEVMLMTIAKAKILWAKDGMEAVNLCREHPEICLVLMDIQMPEMNGYEATRQIKEIRPELPVIAQTAYVMATEKEKCFAAGCQGFLSKPIRREELFKVIKEVLS